jgi:hypothetical protein
MPGEPRKNRFWILFGTLVLLFIVGPILRSGESPRVPHLAEIGTGVLFLVMLLSAVLAVAERWAERVLVIVLLLPYGTLWLVNLFVQSIPLWIVSDAFAMAFIGWVILVLMRHIFRVERVTGDTIAASMCVYLLIAVLWAEAYSIIWMLDQASFSDALVVAGGGEMGPPGHPSVMYFSLVTMTTLGYGDVVPKVGYARTLAATQAVVGQLYIAVLVARLVGLHIAHSKRV